MFSVQPGKLAEAFKYFVQGMGYSESTAFPFAASFTVLYAEHLVSKLNGNLNDCLASIVASIDALLASLAD